MSSYLAFHCALSSILFSAFGFGPFATVIHDNSFKWVQDSTEHLLCFDFNSLTGWASDVSILYIPTSTFPPYSRGATQFA